MAIVRFYDRDKNAVKKIEETKIPQWLRSQPLVTETGKVVNSSWLRVKKIFDQYMVKDEYGEERVCKTLSEAIKAVTVYRNWSDYDREKQLVALANETKKLRTQLTVAKQAILAGCSKAEAIRLLSMN